MRKLFAAVAAWALVGCASTREVRSEEPREALTLEQRRERWDVIHASARTAPAKKESAGTGGAGVIDAVLIEPLTVSERAPAVEGEGAEKKPGAKQKPSRRPLQPGAAQPPPADE